jgi:thiol-disulfide isomerase/thioredoxin
MMRVFSLMFMIMTLVSCSVESVSDNEGNGESIKDQTQIDTILKQGFWRGSLSIDSTHSIPFSFEVLNDSIFFINAEERLGALLKKKGNEVVVRMPIFDSEFKFIFKDENVLVGEWSNYAKSESYKMPFTASFTGEKLIRFTQDAVKMESPKVEGKWEAIFGFGSDDEYKAVGLFEEGNEGVFGTFLTETGDYRFLQGNVSGDSLFLSCFDGAHAFLFEAAFKNDSLIGKFYSGNHYQDNWLAFKNEDFELSNPDSLTRLNIGVDLTFSLPSLTDEPIVYPSEKYKDKVVIIQVMGSWCPNCMDETQLFTDMYNFYEERGLEVIAVAFEKPEELKDKKERVAGLKEYFNAEYDFAIGGKASKVEAQKVLPALDNVLSFPTAIFIDRKGKVRKVHTGFYGPGTGSYYLNYVKSTKSFIEKLLNE